ncbi:MAG: GerMN domain-containing protein [Clostridiales bacterium]|nr:GerMN domain-containing protein [Clostridiales bacterium]
MGNEENPEDGGESDNISSGENSDIMDDNGVDISPGDEKLRIKDYFPFTENTRYVYEGTGNEFASYNVFNDFIEENRVQQRINNGGTETLKVLELKEDELVCVFTKPETYYRENLMKAKGKDEEILLMAPLKEGTSWTLKDSRTRKITGTSVEVTTPAGSYKGIEVMTDGPNGKNFDYYVKGIGLVKSVFTDGESEISSSLSKIETNASLVQEINFYYPGAELDKIYYETKDVSFKTNDITRWVLEKAYKEMLNSKLSKVFSKNTKINSLYLNKDGMVYIDLNKAFIEEMNAGAAYEAMILQSVANTFGEYFKAKKVILTIDNELYESGHISFKKWEYIETNLKDTVEIK